MLTIKQLEQMHKFQRRMGNLREIKRIEKMIKFRLMKDRTEE